MKPLQYPGGQELPLLLLKPVKWRLLPAEVSL